MARPPRTGSWADEYRRRVARNLGLPREVVRGHGPVPIKVARGIEGQIAGRKRALPVKTQIAYRPGIGRYEKKFSGGLRTGHTIAMVFPTKRVAQAYARTELAISPDSDYVEIYKEVGEGGKPQWRIRLLR